MTNNTKTTPSNEAATAFLTPAQMLDLHDRHLAGKPLSHEQNKVAEQIAVAGAFAVEAYHKHKGCHGGAVEALCRSFLIALIDPLHPDLDYLRHHPDLADHARTLRKGGAA